MAETEKEKNSAKVIEFPKEVRVYGQISHVYFEGKNKCTKLIIEQDKPSGSDTNQSKERSSKQPVLIVPVRQKNSELRFVKVPLQKLSRSPKAEKLGDNPCPKISLDGDQVTTETITEYTTKPKEIHKKKSNIKISEFDTCFVFHQSDFHNDLMTESNLPIADLFQFREKSKPETRELEEPVMKPVVVEVPQSVLARKPSVREVETNTEDNDDRLKKFLVSPSKRKRESK